MKGLSRLWWFVLVLVAAAAVGATRAESSMASTVPSFIGTTTCTFSPHPDFSPGGDVQGPLHGIHTACSVRTDSAVFDDTPTCVEGTLLLFGTVTTDITDYFYAGRAVADSLDGVQVPTYDLADVVLPGARLVATESGFHHVGPVARVLGTC